MPWAQVSTSEMAERFLSAQEALTRAIGENASPEVIREALFSALNSFVALDERRDLTAMADLPQSVKGTIVALRWVRNLAHHQWAEALDVQNVLEDQSIMRANMVAPPRVVAAWCWILAERIPRPTAWLNKDPRRKAAYRRGSWNYTHRLARRRAETALSAVAPYVERLSSSRAV